MEEMKKAKVKAIQGEEWKIEGELVLKEKKICVSKNEKLRVEIIQLHHDTLVAGHGGKWKTVDPLVGYSKLLVARGNKRSRAICRRVQFMSANEE